MLPKGSSAIEHAQVADLPRYLPEGALLVVNDTRVMPARLLGRKETGGRVELLLLERTSPTPTPSPTPLPTPCTETWRCLGGSSKGLRPGMRILLDGERPPGAEVMEVVGAEVHVQFHIAEPGGIVAAAERIGQVPLPPYIVRNVSNLGDRARYQTIYARVPGSAAAPTAGLHFTEELLAALRARNISIAPVTLHIGLGTFAPLRLGEEEDIRSITELHAERYEISEETAAAVRRARGEGRPVIAVGTTAARTLETVALGDGEVRAGSGSTRLFIRPGFRFRAIEGLMTNFHLPKSTLLMLVAAFAGRERVLAAYREAIGLGYRFFSYGDAMLIN